MDINGIDNLGLLRVMERGSGEVIEESGTALLVRDDVSGAYLLACDDAEEGMALLDRHASEIGLLMVSNYSLGLAAFEKYGFSEKLECYQVAYYGERPDTDAELFVRAANDDDLPMLTETYHLISSEELEKVVARGSILLGYYGGRLVGFIGEHLEGSMGILYVLPEYRRRGFGAALQKRMIAKTMDEGFIPFGQVEKDNVKSLGLQSKLGMTISGNLIVWMWK